METKSINPLVALYIEQMSAQEKTGITDSNRAFGVFI